MTDIKEAQGLEVVAWQDATPCTRLPILPEILTQAGLGISRVGNQVRTAAAIWSRLEH